MMSAVFPPEDSPQALDAALAQVTQHDLIFQGLGSWGTACHRPWSWLLTSPGRQVPGRPTCVREAIAHSASAAWLLVVQYAELESMWMGETSKNVAAIFRTAREEQAVLLFDEADAIAARRSTSVDNGSQRESDSVVNVLLQELERYTGVVIFATTLRRTSIRRSNDVSEPMSSSNYRARRNASESGRCSCIRPGRRWATTSTSTPSRTSTK